MPLAYIDPRYLDAIWPKAKGLLSSAIEKGRGEMTLDQLHLLIRQGHMHLVLWYEDGSDEFVSVAALEFLNYPSYRVANCAYLSGRYTDESFTALLQWCRGAGASKIQCYADDAAARLYARYGLEKVYNVLRIEL